MKVSREVDLTRNLDFQKEEPKLYSLNINKDDKDDYKRYNEYKDETKTTWVIPISEIRTWFDLGFQSSTTGTLMIPLVTNTKKVEERVCWRKLYKDPDVYTPCRTPEEAIEHMKQCNFALGSKQDRLQIRYENYKFRMQHTSCECCGRPINYGNNCLRGFPDLCAKCAETFYDYSSKKVCWR